MDLSFHEQVQHIWQSYFRFFGVIYPFLDGTAWIGPVTNWPVTTWARRVVGNSRNQETAENKWLFAMVDFAIASLSQESTAVSSPGQVSSSSSATSNEHYTWPWIDQTRPRPFKSRVPEWINRQESRFQKLDIPIPTPQLPFNKKMLRMDDKQHLLRQNQSTYYNRQIPVQVSKRIGAPRYFQSRGSNMDNIIQLHPPILKKNFGAFPPRRYRQIDWNSIQNQK